MYKIISPLALSLLSAACATPQARPIHLQDVGFQTPESVVHDTDHDVYLVSNIAGAPSEADGNGFISRVGPDGQIQNLKWIDGTANGVTLNAPKGLAIANGLVYVADIDTVRMFDVNTGDPKGAIELPGTTFLNDVAAGPDGTVYVSDSGFHPDFSRSGTDAIYAIDPARNVKTLSAGKELGAPNGLLVREDGLWVVTFASGELYRLTADGKRDSLYQFPEGQLDGIVATQNGDLIVSSWKGSKLFRRAGSDLQVAATQLDAPADIAVDAKRGRVLIPLFKDNALRIVPL